MIRWLDARDEFLGIGNVGNYIGHTTPDLVYALDQIRTLINEGFELEEANWLVSLFKENEMVTTEIAAARFKVLIEENPNDARVLCYYGILVNVSIAFLKA